jgi:hypothetical protein
MSSKPKSTTIDAEVLPPETSLKAPGTLAAPGLHNHYHRCAQTAAAQAAQYAVLCGLELQKVRDQLAKPGKRNDNLPEALRGGWESWVKANCDFSPDSARNYMRVAEGIKGKALRECSTPEAIALLDLAPSAMPKAQRENLLKSVSKLTDGQTLQQLYMDFGITKADPRANLRKGGATHNNGRPPAKNLYSEVAHAEAVEILKRLAKFCQTGQHQLLVKADLAHFDQQLLAARETFKPYVK